MDLEAKYKKMVSTRGPRYKFSEGERVLCYEPDPTKAKVLYDSKVLEVIENKDKRGRRSVEYLIHFQGWNSSWDRCVSEDFVLKDTEENRQLQRDLAEKSQLQLGAYLYRRERKKGSSGGSGPGTAKRPRTTGFSDDGSSSSTQPDEGEGAETDSSSGSGSQSPPPSQSGRAHITLPTQLRDRLTFDYHLVAKRGKLSRLPATPCAAEILESFVKWFARAGAWHQARGRHDPPQKPDMLDVSCRLNLVREVADGLRIYFDFVLRGHLLYNQEHDQYHEICGRFLEKEGELKIPSGLESLLGPSAKTIEGELKSPKLPEYSHLPPDPHDGEKNGGATHSHRERGAPCPPPHDHHEDTTKPDALGKPTFKPDSTKPATKPDSTGKSASKVDGSGKTTSKPDAPGKPASKTDSIGKPTSKPEATGKSAAKLDSVEKAAAKPDAAEKPASKPDAPPEDALAQLPAPPAKVREVRSATRSGNVARRLRSHKSVVSQSEEEPAPSTSTGEPRPFETLSSSGSSVSESWGRAAPAASTPPTTRTPLSLLLDKVTKWQIIPRDGTTYLPSRIYGAIHLSRLFVKLPEFLTSTAMPDFKLKLILKHIDMFIQFLDEHSEWFGETYYTADPTAARSH